MLLRYLCERTLYCLCLFAIWTLCFVLCISNSKMPGRCELGCIPDGTPLHRFPNPNKFLEQFEAWVKILGRTLQNPEDYKQYEHKRICSIHFEQHHRNRNNRLNPMAIPSLHLPMWCEVPNEVSDVTSKESECNNESTAVSKGNIEPTIEFSSDFLVAEAKNIVDEHNSCSRGNEPFVGVVEEVGPSTTDSSDLCISDNIISEHNYCSKPGQARMGKKKTTPSVFTQNQKRSSRQVKNLKREVLRLKKRALSFKARLAHAEKISSNIAFQMIAKNMKNPAKIFTKMQCTQSLKRPKGRRFSLEEKILSMSIFKRSPKCYSLLSKYFVLPSKKSMKTLLSSVILKDGINKIIFEKIKKTVAAMNIEDKICTLIFDEMSISPQVHYDNNKDQLKGFTSGKENKKIADHVLVFMVKGIKANFKQPVAYYFTNSLKMQDLKETLIEVIKNVQATGLQILATVCDQSTVNVSAINSLIESTKSEYLKQKKDYNFCHFKIGNKNIIPIYDVPHLLKGLRNNLLTKDLIYTDENNMRRTIKWEYFEKLYAADKSYGELRVAQKLTEEHIIKEKIKKMKVKTAAQVFSHSVAVATEHLSARGDLPQECRDLIPFVILIDNLFDSLNASTFHIPNGKIYKGSVKKNSPHHLLWVKAVKILKTVKFISKKRDKNGKIRLVEATVPSVTNFIKTLEGVQQIWKILNCKYSFDTLLTRNLNQDPVENFFGNIRSYGARNVAPNCMAFEGAFKALLINNYSTPHSIQANCEEDNNTCLQTLDFFLTEKAIPNVPENQKKEVIIYNEIYSENENINDKGQKNYVCGWVLTKCLKNIVKNCGPCKNQLCNEENSANALIRAKEYNRNKKLLCYPNQNVIRIFQDIQKITCNILKKDVPKTGLKANIKIICDTFINYCLSNCNVHKNDLNVCFTETTIKVLIYSWCRSINRILAGKITYCNDDDDHVDEIKLEAQMYFRKHKSNKNQK